MEIEKIIQDYEEGLLTFEETYNKIGEIENKIHIEVFEIQKQYIEDIKKAILLKSPVKIIEASMQYNFSTYKLFKNKC